MDHTQLVADYASSFLATTGFSSEVGVEVEYSEADNLYTISLSSPNPALLIGYHGDTLAALQTILAQHLFAQTSEWLNLTVNVNDYRQRREAALQAMTDAAVEKVVTSGQPFTLAPLPANERRIIHLHLSEHAQVKTESVGEGRQRSVMISPKA